MSHVATTEALTIERRNEVQLHASHLPASASHCVLVVILSMCCQLDMLPPQQEETSLCLSGVI